MNPTLYATRLGLAHGWAEFRQSLTDPQQMGFQVFFAVAFVIVLLFQRGSTVEGTKDVAAAGAPAHRLRG